MADVAVLGIGRMGAAMVGRLVAAGHNVLAWNRDRAKADVLGVPVADSPRVAAAGAAVVLLSLADDAALNAVYHGADGLIAGLTPDTVVVETSTVDPQTVRDLGPFVERAGAVLLDAPVSGSVPVAERGQLTVMVGGEPDALERVRPVLAAFAAEIFHLGSLGAGSTVKLVVNAVVGTVNGALAEGLVLAEKSGLDRSRVYDVLASSVIASPFVQYKRPVFEQPDDAPVAFSLDLVAKDSRLIQALAARVGARLDLLTAGSALVDEARAAGYGPRDMATVAEYLRGR
jgi:3-hydroxyisobutyrate dehydrogenase/2-hydroxy-3-oxopropionate reductase